jgi:hypothetical protein
MNLAKPDLNASRAPQKYLQSTLILSSSYVTTRRHAELDTIAIADMIVAPFLRNARNY